MPDRSYRWEWPYLLGWGGRPLPTVPVVLEHARPTRAYEGLVDSEAELSACSIRIAREAGVDVDRLPVQRIRGIGGVTRARRCPMDLRILGRRIGTEILVIETSIVVLGRRDVFAAFQFGFDERGQTLLIEPYDEA